MGQMFRSNLDRVKNTPGAIIWRLTLSGNDETRNLLRIYNQSKLGIIKKNADVEEDVEKEVDNILKEITSEKDLVLYSGKFEIIKPINTDDLDKANFNIIFSLFSEI